MISNLDILWSRGRTYYLREQYIEAIECFRGCLEIQFSENIYKDLILSYQFGGFVDDEILAFQEIENLMLESPEKWHHSLFLRYGSILDDLEKSERFLSIALQKEALNPFIIYENIKILDKLGKTEQLLPLFRKLLILKPDLIDKSLLVYKDRALNIKNKEFGDSDRKRKRYFLDALSKYAVPEEIIEIITQKTGKKTDFYYPFWDKLIFNFILDDFFSWDDPEMFQLYNGALLSENGYYLSTPIKKIIKDNPLKLLEISKNSKFSLYEWIITLLDVYELSELPDFLSPLIPHISQSDFKHISKEKNISFETKEDILKNIMLIHFDKVNFVPKLLSIVEKKKILTEKLLPILYFLQKKDQILLFLKMFSVWISKDNLSEDKKMLLLTRMGKYLQSNSNPPKNLISSYKKSAQYNVDLYSTEFFYSFVENFPKKSPIYRHILNFCSQVEPQADIFLNNIDFEVDVFENNQNIEKNSFNLDENVEISKKDKTLFGDENESIDENSISNLFFIAFFKKIGVKIELGLKETLLALFVAITRGFRKSLEDKIVKLSKIDLNTAFETVSKTDSDIQSTVLPILWRLSKKDAAPYIINLFRGNPEILESVFRLFKNDFDMFEEIKSLLDEKKTFLRVFAIDVLSTFIEQNENIDSIIDVVKKHYKNEDDFDVTLAIESFFDKLVLIYPEKSSEIGFLDAGSSPKEFYDSFLLKSEAIERKIPKIYAVDKMPKVRFIASGKELNDNQFAYFISTFLRNRGLLLSEKYIDSLKSMSKKSFYLSSNFSGVKKHRFYEIDSDFSELKRVYFINRENLDFLKFINESTLKNLATYIINSFENSKDYIPLLGIVTAFGKNSVENLLKRKILRYLEITQYNWAGELLNTLATIANSDNLTWIYNISQTGSFEERKIAQNALFIAFLHSDKNIDDFKESFIPDFNLSKDGNYIFDYGSRKFELKLQGKQFNLFDERGKIIKTLPKPTQRDDLAKAIESFNYYQKIESFITSEIEKTSVLLKNFLITQKVWDTQSWKKTFIKNRFVKHLIVGCLWSYLPESRRKKSQSLFFMNEKSILVTDDLKPFVLPEKGYISLVHPIDLDSETLIYWKKEIKKSVLKPTFSPIYCDVKVLDESNSDSKEILDFQNIKTSAKEFIANLERENWIEMDISETKIVYHKVFQSINTEIRLSFSKHSLYHYFGDITLDSVMFFNLKTGKQTPIKKVSQILFSELYNEIKNFVFINNNI
ncbi:DUF4132 domain-containing protein [bacterium]|nr:DUF4132 domain-containing protein [bacterium]